MHMRSHEILSTSTARNSNMIIQLLMIFNDQDRPTPSHRWGLTMRSDERRDTVHDRYAAYVISIVILEILSRDSFRFRLLILRCVIFLNERGPPAGRSHVS